MGFFRVNYFKRQGRGEQQKIKCYRDKVEFTIVIVHGNYERVQRYWKPGKEETDVLRYRPAETDVVRYLAKTKEFEIAARNRRDQGFYFEIFNEIFLEDMEASREDEAYWEFTLKPLKEGRFNFSGEGLVEKVDLVALTLRKPSERGPLWLEVRDRDVIRAIRELGLERKIKEMEMIRARFRFYIRRWGKIYHVTFEIKPHHRTTLVGKIFEPIINDYLRKNGVKLH